MIKTKGDLRPNAIPPIPTSGNAFGGRNGPGKPESVQHQIKKLKDSYDLAVLRMNEYSNLYNNSNSANSNMFVKVHGQKASKVYSALSSLIYASIAVAKVDGLEEFVKNNSISLPASIIDLEEWDHILNMAKECREYLILKSLASNPQQHQNLQALVPSLSPSSDTKKKMQLLEFLAINPMRNTRDEVALLRQGMIDELNVYQSSFSQAMGLIYMVVKKLRDMHNADLNAQRVQVLKMQLNEVQQAFETMKTTDEETIRTQREGYEDQINDMKTAHEGEVATLKETAAAELAAQKENYDTEIATTKSTHAAEIASWEKKYQDMLVRKNQTIAEQDATIGALSSTIDDATKQIQSLEEANADLNRQLEEMTRNFNESQVDIANLKKNYEGESVRLHAQYVSEQTITNAVSLNVTTHQEDEITSLADLRDRLKLQIDNLEKDKAQLEAQVARDSKTITDQTRSIAVLEHCKKELEAETALLSDHKDDLTSRVANLEADKTSLSVRQAALEGEKAVLEMQKSGLVNVQSELETQRAKLQAEKEELQIHKNQLEAEKSDLLVIKAKMEASVQELQHTVEQAHASLNELKAAHKQQQDDFEHLNASHSSLGQSHGTIVQSLADVQRARAELEENKKSLEKTIENLEHIKSDLENELKSEQEKYAQEVKRSGDLKENLNLMMEERDFHQAETVKANVNAAEARAAFENTIADLEAVVSELKKEKSDLLNTKAALEESIADLNKSLDQVQASLAAMQKVHDDLQQDFAGLSSKHTHLQSDHSREKATLADVEKSKAELEETKMALEKTIAELRATQSDLEARVNAAEELAANEVANADLYKKQMLLLRDETDTSKRQVEVVQEDTTRFKKGYDKVVFELQSVIEELREKVKVEQAEVNSVQALVRAKDATIDAHVAKFEFQQATVSAQKETMEMQRSKMEELKKEIESLNKEIDRLNAYVPELKARDTEIEALKTKIESQKKEICDLQDIIAANDVLINDCKTTINALSAAFDSHKAASADEIAKLNDTVASLHNDVKKRDDYIDQLTKTVNDLQSSLDSAKDQIGDDTKNIAALQDTVAQQNDELANRKEALDKSHAEIKKYQEKISTLTGEHVAERERLQGVIQEHKKALSDYECRVQQLTKDLKEREKVIDTLSGKLDVETASVLSHEADIEGLHDMVERQKKDIAGLQDSIVSNNALISECKANIATLTGELENTKKSAAEEQNKLNSDIAALEKTVKQRDDEVAKLKSTIFDLENEVRTTKNMLKESNKECADLKSILALQQKDIYGLKYQIDDLNGNILKHKVKNDSSVEESTVERDRLRATIAQHELTIAEKEARVQQLVIEAKANQHLIDSLSDKLLNEATIGPLAHSEMERMRSTIESQKQEIADLDAMITTNKAVISDCKATIDALQSLLAAQKSMMSEEKALQETKHNFATATLSGDILLQEQLAKEELDNATKTMNALNEEKEKILKENGALLVEVNKLQDEIDALRQSDASNKELFENETSSLRKENKSLQASVSELQGYVKSLQQESSVLAEELKERDDHAQIPTNDVTIPTELFNAMEQQMRELVQCVEAEKLQAAQLSVLLQAAERELEEVQEKLVSSEASAKTENEDKAVEAKMVAEPLFVPVTLSAPMSLPADESPAPALDTTLSTSMAATMIMPEGVSHGTQTEAVASAPHGTQTDSAALKQGEAQTEAQSVRQNVAQTEPIALKPADTQTEEAHSRPNSAQTDALPVKVREIQTSPRVDLHAVAAVPSAQHETQTELDNELETKQKALEERVHDLSLSLAEKSKDHEVTLFLKGEQDRLVNILREEVAAQGEEIIALKQKLAEVSEEEAHKQKKKKINFADDHNEVFAIRDTEPVAGPLVPQLALLAEKSPRAEEKSALPLFSPRSAAHYEAQRVVLDLLKDGVSAAQSKELAKLPLRESKDEKSSDAAAGVVDEVRPAAEEKEESKVDEQEKPVEKAEHKAEEKGEEKAEEKVDEKTEEKAEDKLEEKADKKAEDEKEDDKSISSNKKPRLAMASVVSQYRVAVKIQSAVRAFLARRRVRKAQIEQLAANNGVLVACDVTKQGETGWYRVNDQMFYFCLNDKEFVLLCGPISKDLYNVAVEEINQLIAAQPAMGLDEGSSESLSSLSNLKFPHLKMPKNIKIDRLALQATRIQIETLLDDIRTRDQHIARVEEELSELKDAVVPGQAEIIQKQLKQIQEYTSANDALKKEKEVLQLKNRFAKTDMQAVLNEKISSLTTDNDSNKPFVMLSAAVRGFLSRRRVEKLRAFKLADATGVLVAMQNTVQGESGWYVGPQGLIFYFVLKEGKWILTAGPLTEEDFKVSFVQISNEYKKAPVGKLLTKCAFNLAGEHGDMLKAAQLYVSNGNGKLFLALPVDEVIGENDIDEDQPDFNLNSSLMSFNSTSMSKMDSVDSMLDEDGSTSILDAAVSPIHPKK